MKTIVIVGAAGGVGLEVVRSLTKNHNRLIATVRNAAEEAVVRQAVPTVQHVEIVDLSDADTARDVLGAMAAAQPRLDQVVVCAAVAPVGPAETAPLALFRETFDINLVSHVAVYQACLPRLRESKGSILFVSSMSGKIGLPFMSVYTASKFALEGVTDVLRQEAAMFGVRVLLVEPGGIRTPMIEQQYKVAERDLAAMTPELSGYYGATYQGVINAGRTAFESGGLPPADVAAALIDILEQDDPLPRYVVGEDARQMIEARARLDDRGMDRLISGFMSTKSVS